MIICKKEADHAPFYQITQKYPCSDLKERARNLKAAF